MSRQTIGALEEVDVVEPLREPRRLVQVRRGGVAVVAPSPRPRRAPPPRRSRSGPGVPFRCRSCFGSRPCSVMPRAALASMSSTSARGKRMRPSSPCTAPAPVRISTPEGGALEAPPAPARRAPPGGCAPRPPSVSGLVLPALHPRPDGAEVLGQGRRALGRPRGAPAVAPRRRPGGAEGRVDGLVGHSRTRSVWDHTSAAGEASAGTRVPAISIS